MCSRKDACFTRVLKVCLSRCDEELSKNISNQCKVNKPHQRVGRNIKTTTSDYHKFHNKTNLESNRVRYDCDRCESEVHKELQSDVIKCAEEMEMTDVRRLIQRSSVITSAIEENVSNKIIVINSITSNPSSKGLHIKTNIPSVVSSRCVNGECSGVRRSLRKTNLVKSGDTSAKRKLSSKDHKNNEVKIKKLDSNKMNKQNIKNDFHRIQTRQCDSESKSKHRSTNQLKRKKCQSRAAIKHTGHISSISPVDVVKHKIKLKDFSQHVNQLETSANSMPSPQEHAEISPLMSASESSVDNVAFICDQTHLNDSDESDDFEQDVQFTTEVIKCAEVKITGHVKIKKEINDKKIKENVTVRSLIEKNVNKRVFVVGGKVHNIIDGRHINRNNIDLNSQSVNSKANSEAQSVLKNTCYENCDSVRRPATEEREPSACERLQFPTTLEVVTLSNNDESNVDVNTVRYEKIVHNQNSKPATVDLTTNDNPPKKEINCIPCDNLDSSSTIDSQLSVNVELRSPGSFGIKRDVSQNNEEVCNFVDEKNVHNKSIESNYNPDTVGDNNPSILGINCLLRTEGSVKTDEQSEPVRLQLPELLGKVDCSDIDIGGICTVSDGKNVHKENIESNPNNATADITSKNNPPVDSGINCLPCENTIEAPSAAAPQPSAHMPIRLKSPRSLGIVNCSDVPEYDDCRTALRKLDGIRGNQSTVEEICLLFREFFFNDDIKSSISLLATILENIVVELRGNCQLKNCIVTLSHQENVMPDVFSINDPFLRISNDSLFHYISSEGDKENKIFNEAFKLNKIIIEHTLLKYSNLFVGTFKKIIERFEKKKSKSIPIIYFYILKALNKYRPICLINIILQLFQLEDYSCSDDVISSKSWGQRKLCLTIYDRWLDNLFQIKFSHIDHHYEEKTDGKKVIEPDLEIKNDNSIMADDILEIPKSDDHIINMGGCYGNGLSEHVLSIENHVSLVSHQNVDLKSSFDNIGSANLSNSPIDFISQKELEIDNPLLHSNVTIGSEPLSPPRDLPYCTEVSLPLYEDLVEKESDLVSVTAVNLLESSGTGVDSVEDVDASTLPETVTKVTSSGNIFPSTVWSSEDNLNESDIFNDSSGDTGSEKAQQSAIFHMKEGEELFCSNESCLNKLSVPCLYCLEPVSCPDFCEVKHDQFVFDHGSEDSLFVVACDYHKNINRVAFNELSPYQQQPLCEHQPVCWNVRCDRAGVICCVCKTRSYCSSVCQEEDWYNCHHSVCKRTCHPDLLIRRF